MISSYNTTSQTVAAEEAVKFVTDRILTGCTATRGADGVTFTLAKTGYYYISFNAVAAATETVGDITIALYNNGVAVPGAEATYTATTAGNNSNLSFTTIIKVPPSCCVIDSSAKLTVVNTGVEATYSNVNINITKLC